MGVNLDRIKPILAGRAVGGVALSIVVLWVFHLRSYPIGKPLSPLFDLAFYWLFQLRFTVLGPFSNSLILFYVWWAVYIYLLAVFLAVFYRAFRKAVREADEDII